MNFKIPNTPFSTCLSGSAKETELRLRNIFQWKKKRPPVFLLILVAVLLLGICGGLVGFSDQQTDERHLTTLKIPGAMIYAERKGLRSFEVYWQPDGGTPECFDTVTRAKVSTVELTEHSGKLAVRYTDSYNDLSCIWVYALSDDAAPVYLVGGATVPGKTLPEGAPGLEETLGLVPAGLNKEPETELPESFKVVESQSFPSATQIKEMKAERYANAIGSYDTNGDGVLQTLEFPHPAPEVFGLTGADAALFSAVSEYVRQKLYISPEDTMLLLSSVTVYGEYDGENGATHYVCGLWRGMDYDAGTHLAEGGARFGSNWGGGGYLARVTLSADGRLLDVLETQDGVNNTPRIYEICGPLTELAETLRVSEAEGRSLAPRDVSIFTRYLGHYFPSTMAVQENIKDFLRHYMEEYSILVLDANEVTGMVDICLGDYRPEIVAEIKQLVEANYSCSDYLNFEDHTGIVVLTT